MALPSPRAKRATTSLTAETCDATAKAAVPLASVSWEGGVTVQRSQLTQTVKPATAALSWRAVRTVTPAVALPSATTLAEVSARVLPSRSAEPYWLLLKHAFAARVSKAGAR